MAFLLIAPRKTIGGEMVFGLATVWTHPHQAQLSSLDEVAKKLTLLIDLGDNWVYTFMRLNEDSQHVPLSNEGHLSAMIDGLPSRSTCWHLCQLEVCKLLQHLDQVVYPEGLNRGLELVQASLSGSLIQSMDMLGKPALKPSSLLVDLSWGTPGDHTCKASATCSMSTPTSSSHLAIECPPTTDSHISMTAEVQDLLSHAMLDTSSQVSGVSTLKRLSSAALGAPPSTRMEDSSKPIATFPQASLRVASPDDTVPISHSSPTIPVPKTPGVASITATLTSKTSAVDDTSALPKEVLHLQGKMNRIMGQLLMTRASMDAHWRREVSDFQMALHQNEAQTTEVIREAEVVWAAAIREVKACCANIIHYTPPNCPPTNVGTCPCKSPLNCISRACTLFGNQRAMPFT